MSFLAKSANYQRHFKDSDAWRLLRADNAPFILAFIATAFENDSEISYVQAKILLDSFLDEARLNGTWQTESNAATYLNEWINKGWLREMDNRITVTDATDRVLRFCQSFDERMISTSASHLRIVQESVRDFAVMTFQQIFKDKVEITTPAGGMALWVKFKLSYRLEFAEILKQLHIDSEYEFGSVFQDISNYFHIRFGFAALSEEEITHIVQMLYQALLER